MTAGLQIPSPRERRLVAIADWLIAPVAWGRARRAGPTPAPARVLLLRLERMGDLLMVLEAIALVRARWPEAAIDLAVGSWNGDLARLVPGIGRVHLVDVPWLAREGAGLGWPALLARARGWRAHRYDLVLNFEPDIRTNALAWLSGAPRRLGYWTGGGGAFLTDAFAYEPARHVAENALDLVGRATGAAVEPGAVSAARRLVPPAEVVTGVGALVASARRPLVGVHASGGRLSKQWHPDRFAAVGRALAQAEGATIVLTGGAADRALVDEVKRGLAGTSVVDVCGTLGVVELAALLAELDLFVTSDTGPMHLAAAVGTPVVALYGPASPVRYGPRAAVERIVRVQLPCSPCGLVRLPPARCRGHIPDCMDGITVDAVLAAVRGVRS